jgi:hypothetical protein
LAHLSPGLATRLRNRTETARPRGGGVNRMNKKFAKDTKKPAGAGFHQL